MNGCRIPIRAAATWLSEDGPFEYWRGTITAFDTSDLQIDLDQGTHLRLSAIIARYGLASALSKGRSAI